MSYFCSKHLLAAKSISAKDWSHPRVIIAARRLAHEGKTVGEISEAVGWNISYSAAQARLKKFNIKPLPEKNRKAHRGFETSLQSTKKTGGIIDQSNFRPRTKAGVECF